MEEIQSSVRPGSPETPINSLELFRRKIWDLQPIQRARIVFFMADQELHLPVRVGRFHMKDKVPIISELMKELGGEKNLFNTFQTLLPRSKMLEDLLAYIEDDLRKKHTHFDPIKNAVISTLTHFCDEKSLQQSIDRKDLVHTLGKVAKVFDEKMSEAKIKLPLGYPLFLHSVLQDFLHTYFFFTAEDGKITVRLDELKEQIESRLPVAHGKRHTPTQLQRFRSRVGKAATPLKGLLRR